MADFVKQILSKPIQLADEVAKVAAEATSFKQDCAEVKSKTERLAALLRQAARAGSDLYERPTLRIVEESEQVLDKALGLVRKCQPNGVMKLIFTIIPANAFKKLLSQLENSIGDVSWLLRVSAPSDDRDDEYLGLPPIAANEPILCLIWEQIAILSSRSLENRADAAASLVSLARDNRRYGKLIVQEGGLVPLLKLVKEGKIEGQENAARAIGLLASDPDSVDQMILAGVCSIFVKVLKEGPMRVQAVVAWAVSELADRHPKSQDLFAQHNIIRLLVSHLAFETVQEHSKYAIAVQKATSIHAVVIASNNPASSSNDVDNQMDAMPSVPRRNEAAYPRENESTNQLHSVVTDTIAMNATSMPAQARPGGGDGNNDEEEHGAVKRGNSNNGSLKQNRQQSGSFSGSSKGREHEDPVIKADMKAMAARALGFLAIDNPSICRSITESRALLCFAVLLEKGAGEVQYNSAIALMRITAVAEKDSDLRRSAFKPNSPACKAVVNQLLRIVGMDDTRLLIPSINAIGNLARTFRATETRMISPLVKLLDHAETDVCREASIALTKFACTENYLHVDHSKAIITADGVKNLIQLVYFGEQIVQSPALIVLSYIALHVPDSEVLASAEVLSVLEWASKQSFTNQGDEVSSLLSESKSRLDLYQSRGSKGFS